MFTIVDDIAIHARIDGAADAPALVLLHSLGTSAAVWELQVECLRQHFRVICPDLRGHGLTEATPGDYTIAGLAGDVTGLLDRLGIARAHLGGLSIGGMVAQHLATATPERFASLALCDTAMAIPPASLWQERAALVRRDGLGAIEEVVLARWISPACMKTAAGRGLRMMFRRTSVEGYAGCAAAIATADLASRIAGIAIPTLVLIGAHDEATPRASAEALCAALPQARLVVIDDAAHIPTVEAPDAVTAALLHFFLSQGER